MTKLAVFALFCLLFLGGHAAAEEAPARVVLSFAGDCTLGSTEAAQSRPLGFVSLVAEQGFAYPFSGVAHIFQADDLTLVNLEGVFTLRKQAQEKSFVFRAPPDYAQILPLGGVEAVNTANNHSLDYYREGREDTMAALDAVGVQHSGNGEMAARDVQGIRIGMTGYSYPHRNTLESLEKDIEILRDMGCDLIIFSMHAGIEEQYAFTDEQAELARGAIDLGVDVVIGHHAHVLQGIELYQGKPIFYGLGNFAFGGNNNPDDWDTMIAQLEYTIDEAGNPALDTLRVIPCLLSSDETRNNYRPIPAEGERASAIFSKLADLSEGLIDLVLFETGVLTPVPIGL
ncbi:MAG: CapA family protein [Oscillospiraceae bacterium]|jgi:poly-gamma-glutamate synthesis protein (capsule biosynthesis protein)|nr:CapA family protein [Oscillospiraceae bacterium]